MRLMLRVLLCTRVANLKQPINRESLHMTRVVTTTGVRCGLQEDYQSRGTSHAQLQQRVGVSVEPHGIQSMSIDAFSNVRSQLVSCMQNV